jgi:hypothetical protein
VLAVFLPKGGFVSAALKLRPSVVSGFRSGKFFLEKMKSGKSKNIEKRRPLWQMESSGSNFRQPKTIAYND